MNRRAFLKLSASATVGCAVGGLGYSYNEIRSLQVTRVQVRVPHLPAAFAGTTIAFVSDLHHSQFVPRDYLEKVVTTANALQPDYVVLGGDYVTAGHKYSVLRGQRYLDPCFDILKNLHASAGRFAVMGNHDYFAEVPRVHAAMGKAGFLDLTNGGVWMERGGARLRVCGVGDLKTQRQDLPAALADAKSDDAVILVSHNPDYAEWVRDPRVGLMLSGHTHGGQVVLPFVGALRVPSDFGQKYRYGLVQAPHTAVYVTSGIGVLPVPFRFGCPPEVAFLTLC